MGLKIVYEPGQTPLDPGEAEGLILGNISTQNELNEFEQLNIQAAMEWSLGKRFRPEKAFSEGFITRLHLRMYRNVWRWAGQFRKTEKNIGVEPHQIAVQLRQLTDDALWWTKHSTYTDDEIAIRFKHRIVKIHCFPNGNGRHSRLMADIILGNVFNKGVFSWGGKDLQRVNDSRKQYINVLQQADRGDLSGLLAFAKSGREE